MARCILKVLTTGVAVAGAVALAPERVHPKHRPRAAKAASHDACLCKNWKEAYESGLVSCGAGNEFFLKTGKSKPDAARLDEAKQELGGVICDKFYQKLDNNNCVNVNMGKDHGQWCYVDAACKALNNGAAVPGSKVSWKVCQKGQDAMFRDLLPEDLNAYAKKADVQLGLLHKMAYPLSRAWQNKRFEEVQGFWGIGNVSASSLPDWLRTDMQKIAGSNAPYSFDNSMDEHPPHTIVVGQKVYAVEDSAARDEAHPGTWEDLRCVKGC